MASMSILILTCLLLSTASFHVSNASLVLPIVKDTLTPQYFTSFLLGTPPTRVNLAVDLSNLGSWVTCAHIGFTTSATFQPLPCNTPKCTSYAGLGFCLQCYSDGPSRPGCSNDTCGAVTYSPWYVPDDLASGGIMEDVISLYNQVGKPSRLHKTSLPHFPIICAGGTDPLQGLSPYAKGILTLARHPMALHAQISSFFKVPHKFALCLPSSSTPNFRGNNGAMFFGGGPYYIPSNSSIDLAKELITTPLLLNPHSTVPGSLWYDHQNEPSVEYFIQVNSIRVDGTPVRFQNSLLSFANSDFGVGGTKISTMEPYTKLHSDIYKVLIDVFVSKATAMKIERVASIDPFGACFSRKSIANTITGPRVPIIDFVLNGTSPILHGKPARWRIYGSNSMVRVFEDVLCLGFVENTDPGETTSILLAGKQMEDTLVEIDLEKSMVGITSSLRRFGTSCSLFKGV